MLRALQRRRRSGNSLAYIIDRNALQASERLPSGQRLRVRAINYVFDSCGREGVRVRGD